MSAKHTKGPWKVGSRELFSDGSREGFFKIEGFVGDSNEQEYRVANVVDANDSPQNEANARLIAAAPELLALVERLTEEIRELAKRTPTDDTTLLLVQTADAAIAKARGES